MSQELINAMNKVSHRSLDGTVVMGMDEWNRIVGLVGKLLDDQKEKERIAMSRGVAIALANVDPQSTEYHDAVMSQGGYEELYKEVEEFDREHLIQAAGFHLGEDAAEALKASVDSPQD